MIEPILQNILGSISYVFLLTARLRLTLAPMTLRLLIDIPSWCLVALNNTRLIYWNNCTALLCTQSHLMLILLLASHLKNILLCFYSSIFESGSSGAFTLGHLLIYGPLWSITRWRCVRDRCGLDRNLIGYVVRCAICICGGTPKNDILLVLTVKVLVFVRNNRLLLAIVRSIRAAGVRNLTFGLSGTNLFSLWISHWTRGRRSLISAINVHSICGPNGAALTFLTFLTLRGLLKLNRRNGIHATFVQLMTSAQNGLLLCQKTSSLMLLLGTVAFGDCKTRTRTLGWRVVADSLFTGIEVLDDRAHLRVLHLLLLLLHLRCLFALATARCSSMVRLTVWGRWWLEWRVRRGTCRNRRSILLYVLICSLKMMVLITNDRVLGRLARAIFWICCWCWHVVLVGTILPTKHASALWVGLVRS